MQRLRARRDLVAGTAGLVLRVTAAVRGAGSGAAGRSSPVTAAVFAVPDRGAGSVVEPPSSVVPGAVLRFRVRGSGSSPSPPTGSQRRRHTAARRRRRQRGSSTEVRAQEVHGAAPRLVRGVLVVGAQAIGVVEERVAGTLVELEVHGLARCARDLLLAGPSRRPPARSRRLCRSARAPERRSSRSRACRAASRSSRRPRHRPSGSRWPPTPTGLRPGRSPPIPRRRPCTPSCAARWSTAPRMSFSAWSIDRAIIFCSASSGCSVVSPR